ncbi:MAG TPA: ABC transporter ATP-binding protein [Nocardioides sp.]
MTALVVARGLTAGYSAVPIVRDLDLEVQPGEVVALIGANGAGKTTTLSTLSGELPPLAGEILFDGHPPAGPLHVRARRGLGLVTEERSVLMRLTVAQNLAVARCDTANAYALFPELQEHARRPVGLLSGGQQQMLALARALGRRPTLLLADELSLGLAPIIVDRLLRTIRAAADDGLGVLLVEQHVHKALRIADRAYVMQRGRIVLHGTAADLREQLGEIQSTYLTSHRGA